jgi:hypothetical protein
MPPPIPSSTPKGQGWADIIDFLTMHPEARRRVTWLPAEIDTEGGVGV